MSAEIKSIEIQIGRKRLILELEDAKNLYEALHDFFGKKQENITVHWPQINRHDWPEPVKSRWVICDNNTAKLMYGCQNSELKIKDEKRG